MSLNLSLNLETATFADLAALVEAARTAGIDPKTLVTLDDDSGHLTVEAGGNPVHASKSDPLKDHPQRPAPGSGTDAALKFIAQLLGEDRRPNQ